MSLINKIFFKKEEILYKEVLFSDLFSKQALLIANSINKYIKSNEKKEPVIIYTDAALNNDGAFLGIYTETKLKNSKEVIKILNFQSKNINVLESLAVLYGFIYSLDKNYKAVIYNDNKVALNIFRKKILSPFYEMLSEDKKEKLTIRFNYISGEYNRADPLIRKIRIKVFGKTYKQVKRKNKKKKKRQVSLPEDREV